MYAFDSRIRYSETDSEGELTLNALLNYFQDCSTFHSEDVGLGIGYMKEIGQAWVLSSWQIVVDRYPRLGEKVKIVTLPYELKAFLGYRNFAMLDEKGEYIAKANSLWSLLDVATGKPVTLSYTIDEQGLNDAIGLELVVLSSHSEDDLQIHKVHPFEMVKQEGNLFTFKVTFEADEAGSYKCAVRMYPKNDLLPHRQDFCYVKWID